MRILHTADWHLGKIVNEFSMLEDQADYLNQLIDQIKLLDIDAVIMAGDLYDRSIPPKEAINLANRILTRLIKEIQVPVFVIAGNHDSNERIEYGTEMLAESQLYIEGLPKKQARKVTVDGMNFYLLPFADYVTVRHLLENSEIHNNEDALRAQVKEMMEDFDPEAINILIMHGYLINQTADSVEASDSERPLSIGTAEFVEAGIVDMFDYVALGHLHKAQKVKSEKIRYSGSPLKYSKSEVNHKKKSLIVEIEKDHLTVESLFIEPTHDMKVLRGKFAELMEDESDDYVFFELEDDEYVMDAMNRLRKRYPNAMALEYTVKERKMDKKDQQTQETIQRKSNPELFEDFYDNYKDQDLTDKQKEAVHKSFEEVQKEED